MRYQHPFEDQALDELLQEHLGRPERPPQRTVATYRTVGLRMHPEDIDADFARVGRSEFLVARQTPFVVYGGDLPFDVLLVVGFDGVNSPLLDLRLMSRWDTAEPVTSTRLRKVPVDQLVREAVTNHRPVFRQESPGVLVIVQDEEQRSAYVTAVTDERNSSRRRTNEDELVHVAWVYRLAVLKSMPPTRAVQDALHLPNRNIARKMVERARAKGYLEPAVGPRRGGTG